jgi:hypothetical protein
LFFVQDRAASFMLLNPQKASPVGLLNLSNIIWIRSCTNPTSEKKSGMSRSFALTGNPLRSTQSVRGCSAFGSSLTGCSAVPLWLRGSWGCDF